VSSQGSRHEYLLNKVCRGVRKSLPIFLSAAVYEMAKESNGALRLKSTPRIAFHCKTCDIADPYQIIDWVVPEGGGGPNYEGM